MCIRDRSHIVTFISLSCCQQAVKQHTVAELCMFDARASAGMIHKEVEAACEFDVMLTAVDDVAPCGF